MSTPNLKKDGQVLLNLPFNDERLDILFSMRMNPKSQKEIEETFEIEEKDRKLFQSFFTEEKPICSKISLREGSAKNPRLLEGHTMCLTLCLNCKRDSNNT